MACPYCGSARTVKNGGNRRRCLDPDHTIGPTSYDASREIREGEIVAAIEARQGYAPQQGLNHLLPPGQKLKGVSTMTRNEAGEIQWVKSAEDVDAWHMYVEATLAGMIEKIPREKPRPAPKHVADDLLTQYTITDYHLGMLAWGEETGADWDLKIAEDMLVDWFAAAIAQSPPSRTAVFAQLGDFLHWDGMDAVTPAHHNLLDADTRFQKLVRVAIRVLRRITGMLLAKHEHVILLMAEGNHDPASSIHMREWLAAMYEDEPRIEVILSPDPYYCIEHGQTALFYHHGHKSKIKDIDKVFVAKFREVFGRCTKAYAHMGHLHHIDVKESSLMVVEQHRTLAASDAYASRGGWLSGREAKVICYHKRYGETSRITLSSAMFEPGG